MIREVAVWLWGVVKNPDVVWVDTHTGEETRERWKRRDRFRLLCPLRYVFTTRSGCGCLRRFGLWKIAFCAEHARVWLER